MEELSLRTMLYSYLLAIPLNTLLETPCFSIRKWISSTPRRGLSSPPPLSIHHYAKQTLLALKSSSLHPSHRPHRALHIHWDQFLLLVSSFSAYSALSCSSSRSGLVHPCQVFTKPLGPNADLHQCQLPPLQISLPPSCSFHETI